MNDLLTLDQAAALWKSLKKKHPSIPAMPAQSLRVHARSEGLAGEIVDGALYIRKDSLLKMVKGLRVWEAAWGADLEATPVPELIGRAPTQIPDHADLGTAGTLGSNTRENRNVNVTISKAEWQAEVLNELRAIHEMLGKVLESRQPA
jgi:hypothetical protein